MSTDHVTDRSYLSGEVKRYSVWPVLLQQTVGSHTWGVYHVYWMVFGVPSAQVALYIHMHDAEELVSGDNPFPMKMRYPKLKEAITEIERDARAALSLPDTVLPSAERHRVKVCDLLEMTMKGMLEREMGNLLAVPIIERTAEAALNVAEELLSIEDLETVSDFVATELARHRGVLQCGGSTR